MSIIKETFWVLKEIIKDGLEWIWDLTWRPRHIWTYGHIPFKAEFSFESWRCRSCFRMKQRKEKGEVI